MVKFPMTKQGVAALLVELETLKTIERPKVIAAIAEARAHGDLSENAEYSAAREKQSFMEGRIRDIEGKLSNSQIIDVAQIKTKELIVFGATVEILNIDTDKKFTYQIVGDDEADIKHSKISINSPLARALVGKRVDDIIEVTTPSGLDGYEVLKISYI